MGPRDDVDSMPCNACVMCLFGRSAKPEVV